MISHRKSLRLGVDSRDLEFEVVWITSDGDVTTWEPAQFLSAAGNVDFKAYLSRMRLGSRVRDQVTRVSHLYTTSGRPGHDKWKALIVLVAEGEVEGDASLATTL